MGIEEKYFVFHIKWETHGLQFIIKRMVVIYQLVIQILKSRKSKICQWYLPKALEIGCFHSKYTDLQLFLALQWVLS